MPNRWSAGSRDKNEGPILEVIKRYGFDYLLMPEGMGFDVLVYLPGEMLQVEVKNPERPPSARVLTAVEQARREVSMRLDIPYFVIETPEGMAELIASRL